MLHRNPSAVLRKNTETFEQANGLPSGSQEREDGPVNSCIFQDGYSTGVLKLALNKWAVYEFRVIKDDGFIRYGRVSNCFQCVYLNLEDQRVLQYPKDDR